MTDYVQGTPREQSVLFLVNLESAIEQDNPVRFIDAWANQLEMQKLGFTHAEPSQDGRPPYDPKDLLKLHLYGGLNRTRTSRVLERQCYINIEVRWLMHDLKPDHWTISEFRKNNPESIKSAFKDFVAYLNSLDLFGAKQEFIDGSKFKAQNAIDRCFTTKTLAKRVLLIEKSIARHLEEMDAADQQENTDEVQAEQEAQKQAQQAAQFRVDKLAALIEKKEKYCELLDKVKASGQKEVSLTDEDCRLMKNRGKTEPCYNVQAAVDSKNHLIVNYEVTNEATDHHQLSSMAIGAKQMLGVERLDAIVDKGYFDSLEIKRCADNGVVPYVAVRKCSAGSGAKKGIPASEFTADKFIYDKAADVYVCPAGQQLVFYSSTINHKGMQMRVYKCTRGVCSSCAFFMTKCTKNAPGRSILRWVHQEVIDEMKHGLWLHPELMDERKSVAEHPFGTIKRAFGAPYLLLKGLKKVGGEVGLLMIAYNLRRALNILGVERLTQARVKV